MILTPLIENWPLLLEGTLMVIKLFAVTLVIALPLGLPVALGAESKFVPVKVFCKAYVWIFRGTPLLMQLFFFYFFIPINLGVTPTLFVTVAITFALNYAAYFAEIYRGGINGIHRGQFEAAHSLGLSKWDTMKDIILPQTMKAILPSIFNEIITLVKDTALAQTLGMMELMKVTYGIVNRTSVTTIFLYTALIYLALNLVITMVSGRLEKHFNRYDAKEEF
ncbi:amino acid ABC transporter permease [Eubacteriales bacterium KG127]